MQPVFFIIGKSLGGSLLRFGHFGDIADTIQYNTGAVGVGVQRLAGGIAAVVGEEQVLLFCIGLQTLYHPEGEECHRECVKFSVVKAFPQRKMLLDKRRRGMINCG